jgi:lon-related putative ATP-dependent protease
MSKRQPPRTPSIHPLPASKLTWVCPPSALPFKSTKELKPLTKIVGQDRAIEALRLGARIRSQGYNIWASGVVGTGRMTTIRKILDEVKHDTPVLHDFAYVHNFASPDRPVLLRFAAGEGRVFRRMMEDALAVLQRRIPSLFEETQFQTERTAIITRFQAQEDALLKEFDSKLRPEGLTLGQVQEEDGATHAEIFPIVNNEPMTMDEVAEAHGKGTISDAEFQRIQLSYTKHRDQLTELGGRSIRIAASFRKELSKYDQAAVGTLIESVFADVRASFQRDRVAAYLTGIQQHLLDHLEEFVKLQAARLAGAPDDKIDEAQDLLTEKYRVNLLVDNYATKVAPVIVETSPTYSSLFGTIERRIDARGYAVSDFSQIRAGSLLRADGGFVVMNAMDVLSDEHLWTALKRVLLYGHLEMQSPESQFQLNTLKPDTINVNVKVILLGDPAIYHALWEADEDFHKMFKIHAEFEGDIHRTAQMMKHYAQFFARLAEEEQLLHCDRSGAAALIEWAVAYTSRQEKITLQFSYVADVLREAEHFARQAGANVISRTHVRHALDQRRWRSNATDLRLREEIKSGSLLIDVIGARVGQVNGLTVYQAGIVGYGKPSRITATVSAGSRGIINIEREVDLSGPIHSKGVLILSGLLRSLFSRSQPMSFTASVAFEQSYGGVDGDSASAAEMIALLSAISNVPIRQDIAITGSINQKGDIQPVGGINEKIIGFFEVCEDRGLTGQQGVIIPAQNVNDLMLRDDVIAAVRKKKFAVYPITRLEQAVALLTGMAAGESLADGQFAEGTLFGKVQTNLDVLHEASRLRTL